jgi:hypothetical protein
MMNCESQTIEKPKQTLKPLIFITKTKEPHQFLRIKRINLIRRKNEKINKDGFRIGKWDHAEHREFLNACLIHGNNWAKVRIA